MLLCAKRFATLNEKYLKQWVNLWSRPYHRGSPYSHVLRIARSVLSVVAAFITGVVYLIPLNFVLTRIPDLLAVASLQPMPLLFKFVVGSAGGAFGLLFLILGIWLFAAIGSLTAASRCTWSFSRDGGIPGSGFWKKVNKRFGLPVNALILSTIVDALLGLIYLGSSAAFNAFTGGKRDKEQSD